MQVVDLRPGRRAAPRPLRVWASPAAELVRSTAALTDNEDWEGFDVGDDRLAEGLDAEDWFYFVHRYAAPAEAALAAW